jgi:DNA-binding XRE family transcriptional regulator
MRKLKKLKACRAEREWTQMDTSDRSGIPYQRYVRMENGYIPTSPSDRATLARLFRVTQDDLFGATT